MQLCCQQYPVFSWRNIWSSSKKSSNDFRTHTLKAFHHFKNKQQKCMKLSFLTCKSINILKVVYTLRIKQAVQKMLSFFFRELQLITVLLLICDSYMSWSPRFVSLKICVEFSIFWSRFVFIKVDIFVQQNAWAPWL